jgi:hypothetical protein
VAALAFASLAIAPTRATAQVEDYTSDSAIAGKMTIDFKTRTELDEGKPKAGVADVYTFTLAAVDTVQFEGEVKRQPKLTGFIGRETQPAQLFYDVSLVLRNPNDLKQKRNVGKWVGTVPMDIKTGVYDLAGGQAVGSPLRFSIDTVGRAQGFTDNFAGKLIGKAEKKDGLISRTYNRVVGGRNVKLTIAKSDPMTFQNMELAKGPVEAYPRTTVNGSFDYDYETGNWFTDGIKFSYTFNGKPVEDVLSGTIKWVEDPDRASNGKGYYEVNLRYNEERHKTQSTEGNAFEKMTDEEAFFAVDNTLPSLGGRIEYVDRFVPGSDAPASSDVVFKITSTKLSKQQVVNFFKLWLVCIGPTNDE